MHVTRKSIQLCYDNRTLGLTGLGKGSSEFWPTFQRVGALAGFNLDKLTDEFDILGLGKASDNLALCLKAQARTTLPLSGNAKVGDCLFHSPKLPVGSDYTHV
jgi:hypothetical protein